MLKTGVPSFNHIAIVLFPFKLENYLPLTLYSENLKLKESNFQNNTDPDLTVSKLENEIIVLDLFYKEEPQTIKQWIEKRNYNNEEFKLGREYDFA